jgi:hypothetical protein
MRSKIFTRTVGYWPLQESSGQAQDYSGNENHATTTQVTNYDASGPLGGTSMDFDGSDDYIVFNSSYADETNSWTISCWINPKDATNGGRPINWRANMDAIFAVGQSSNNNLDWYDGNWHTVTSGNISTNQWYLITATHNASTFEQHLYLNGVRELTISSSPANTSTENRIGSDALNENNFNGKIAHVQIWDYPLPEAQIRALYNASKGGFTQSKKKTS